MTNSVDPDQTASIGAVCSRSTLFASILNTNVRQLFVADNFRRRHFHRHFFLCALRVKAVIIIHNYIYLIHTFSFSSNII